MSWRSKSYEVLPALSVRGGNLRRSLRTVTAAWMFGIIWMVGIGGATMLNFGYLAGFTEFQWGVFSALIFAATLAQLPASYLVERTGLRKIQFLQSTTMSRLLWIVVATLPVLLLILPNTEATRAVIAWSALALIFTSWMLSNFGAPGWMTWMADLIPSRIRGRYLARRQYYTVLIQLLAAVAVGVALDQAIPLSLREGLRNGQVHAPDVPVLAWVLLVILAIAGVAGTIDVLLFRRVREIRNRPARPTRLLEVLRGPMRNRRFVRFAGSMATLTFGVAMAMPFFWRQCQRQFGLSNLQCMLVMTIASPLGGMVSVKAWGRAIDRWGRRPVMMLAMGGMVFSVWGWLLVPQEMPYLVAVVVFWGGIVWSGFLTARMGMYMSFSDTAGRSTYVAAVSVAQAVAGTLGGLAGGWIAQATAGMRWELGPFIYVNYHVTFLLGGVFRALGILWLIRMPDPGSTPVGAVARQMATGAYQGISLWLFPPLRLLYRPVHRALRNSSTRREEP